LSVYWYLSKETVVIKLYTAPTTNGRKISIALEELELPYSVVLVDLDGREQFAEWFLAISPNNKVPAIIDEDANGQIVFESAAILQYLAEKGGALLPAGGAERFSVLAWLSWQISGLGPTMFQLGHFSSNESQFGQRATAHFGTEIKRLLGVLEGRLKKSKYVGSDDFTIADIAIFPQVLAAKTRLTEEIRKIVDGSPNVLRWLDVVGDRPAVRRGMKVP
jgi:GST-like protein